MSVGQHRARRNDRLAFLVAHPVLYPALGALSRPRLVATPRGLLINDPVLARTVLAQAPLDRAGPDTTGGLIAEHLQVTAWFNDDAQGYRARRHALTKELERVTQVDSSVALAAALDDGPVDAAASIAATVGELANTLLGTHANPQRLVAAAETLTRRGMSKYLRGRGDLSTAVADLVQVITDAPRASTGLLATADEPSAVAAACVAATATIATTNAAGTRALAYLADADLWDSYRQDPDAMVDELLRVLTPSPLLPRRLAEPFPIDGRIRAQGTRLLVNVRAACRRTAGWRVDPRRSDPALARLVFGFGTHSCPGSQMARQTLRRILDTFAPHAPRVRRRHAARGGLPRWDVLELEATR